MGKLLVVFRLGWRDTQRHWAEAALLLLVIVAACTTLTLGLVLHGETEQPYTQTRNATIGPDDVASIYPAVGNYGNGPGPAGGPSGGQSQSQPVTCSGPGQSCPAVQTPRQQMAQLLSLEHKPSVIASSGPYPVTWAEITWGGHLARAEIEARDLGRAAVDQPSVTDGTWIHSGGVVLERTFAEALGVSVGDEVRIGGVGFRVVGFAVTAAFSPFPQLCSDGCGFTDFRLSSDDTGLVWMTRPDLSSIHNLVGPVTYYLNLRLKDPSNAVNFANEYTNVQSFTAPSLTAWQWISQQDGNLVKNEQRVLLIGSWLLGFLAMASVAVLVGSRMADQTRRVGLMKAVGASPKLVACVLLTQCVGVALVAGLIGLGVGLLVTPIMASPGAGLLGTPGAPPVTGSNVAVILGMAVAVAVAATFVPAVRAARTSTVAALADAARPPRRGNWLIAVSRRLPVPLLLGVRVAARRPRRIVLTVLSVGITITGIVAIMIAHTRFDLDHSASMGGLANPRIERLSDVMLVLTVMLATMSAVNLVFLTLATVLDAKKASAVTRALGATPSQVTAGLSAAQVLPALAGVVLGIPGGFLLFAGVSQGESSAVPPIWWLVTLVIGSLAAAAGVTAVPARIGGRRPAAEVLQAELA